MGYYYRFPKYVTVAEKQAKAEKKLKQLRKKNPDIQPVTIAGRAIALTWWGKEWNNNLERYADYSNRIGRGRSYVRHGAVLDLKVKPGKIEALVQGGESRPYEVNISIDGISPKTWAEIKKQCRGQMDSLQKLIAGKFPKAMKELFIRKGTGLFPAPKEIHFNCSCPDTAYMCKHVAATLYGIGARLDEDPNLFFALRKVDVDELVTETLTESREELLSRAEQKSSRIISDDDDTSLSELFGIDLDDGSETKVDSVEQVDTAAGDKDLKTLKPPKAKAKPVPKTQSKPAKKKLFNSRREPVSPLDEIEKIIKSYKSGIAVADIITKVSMEPQKVRNILYRLKAQGKIENISRGIYKVK